MGALTGQSIASSYEQLLHVDTDGGGAGATLVPVKDGDNGTTFCISMTDASTGKAVLAVDGSHASGTEVQIDNSATDGDAFLSFQLSGTSKFTMGVDDGDSDKFKIGTTAIGTGTMFALDTNSRISLSNNDSGGTGGTDSTTGNTVMGYLAGAAIESGGVDNTIYGHKAGNLIDTGDDNVIMGNEAGKSVTIGRYNTAIGTQSLLTEDVGDRSVAIGYSALYSQNSDSNNEIAGNVGIGFQAGNYNVTGQNNTYVGYLAGLGVSGQSNSSNTAVGKSALSAVTNGGQNVAVGANVGANDVNLTTGDENTILGCAADVSTADAQNQTVIGFDTTGQADNSVTLGNASVTAVYMAQDSGATIYHAGAVSTGEYKSTRSGNSYSFWGVNSDSVDSNNVMVELDYDSDDDGTGGYFVRMQDSGGEIGSIKIASSSGVAFNTTSDYRLKENEVLITDGLDMVNNLKPYRFNFKGYQDKIIDGFFAHEVEPYVPTAVSGEKDAVREDGSILPQSMDYGQMVTVMVAAIQELSAKVEELENK